MMDGRKDGRTDRETGWWVGEWMGWRVNSLVSRLVDWLVGWLVGWLIEKLEIKLVMFSDLTSFPRQINAISDFSRQAEKPSESAYVTRKVYKEEKQLLCQ